MVANITAAARCTAAGCSRAKPYAGLPEVINQVTIFGRDLHFLPSSRGETTLELSRLLRRALSGLKTAASPELIQAVVGLREIKTDLEVAEIESALDVADEMHRAAWFLREPTRYAFRTGSAVSLAWMFMIWSLSARTALATTINFTAVSSSGSVT